MNVFWHNVWDPHKFPVCKDVHTHMQHAAPLSWEDLLSLSRGVCVHTGCYRNRPFKGNPCVNLCKITTTMLGTGNHKSIFRLQLVVMLCTFVPLDDPTFSRMGGVNSGTFKLSVGYGFYLRINKSLYLCSFLQILQTVFCRTGGTLRNCLERIWSK